MERPGEAPAARIAAAGRIGGPEVLDTAGADSCAWEEVAAACQAALRGHREECRPQAQLCRPRHARPPGHGQRTRSTCAGIPRRLKSACDMCAKVMKSAQAFNFHVSALSSFLLIRARPILAPRSARQPPATPWARTARCAPGTPLTRARSGPGTAPCHPCPRAAAASRRRRRGAPRPGASDPRARPRAAGAASRRAARRRRVGAAAPP